jgi:hypothetical protein
MKPLSELGTNRPLGVIGASMSLAFVALLLAALPSMWPGALPQLHGIRIDTDSKNMLSSENPTRIFHRSSKAEFILYDQIALGVVNDQHPFCVFNANTIANVIELTRYAQALKGVVSDSLLTG